MTKIIELENSSYQEFGVIIWSEKATLDSLGKMEML